MAAYILPDALRGELAAPFGEVLATDGLETRLRARLAEHPDLPFAAVGDVVGMTLLELGLEPAFIACDHKTQRGDDDPALVRVLGGWGDHEIRVANPAARLDPAAWDAVATAWRTWETSAKRTCIVVDGEEDLLGIPAFLEAPAGAVVLYGMPGRGVVWVEVDDALRARVAELLERFEKA